jgi:hypothetical protein
MNCCICGPVKNCAKYLKKVFENIDIIGRIFDDYEVILFYDQSEDATLAMLKKYQIKNPKVKLYVNKKPISKYRTHNISHARNFCLNYVKKNYEKFPFFIMMDMDDPNAKNVNVDILQKYLTRDDWDSLSFNTSPKYYDIWGLSIYPYCFSYNHFESNVYYYDVMQKYVMDKLDKLGEDELLQCISAFNGFAIYRTEKFMNTYYDGSVRIGMFPKHMIEAHSKAQKSGIVFKDYGNVNGFFEDCEHRLFHFLATKNSGAKIRISPEILFS